MNTSFLADVTPAYFSYRTCGSMVEAESARRHLGGYVLKKTGPAR